MATIRRRGSIAEVSGEGAEEVFRRIAETPAIGFKERTKAVKRYRVRYSRKGWKRVLRRLFGGA